MIKQGGVLSRNFSKNGTILGNSITLSTDVDPEDHFRDVTKMVTLGSGSKREITDFLMLRV